MKQTVLVVDDTLYARTMIRNVLEPEYEVVAEAETGAEAVHYYKKTNPDLVLMDIRIPRPDGLTATRAILDYDENARVLMITGVKNSVVRRQAREAGANGYLTKPFAPEELREMVHKVLSTSDETDDSNKPVTI